MRRPGHVSISSQMTAKWVAEPKPHLHGVQAVQPKDSAGADPQRLN
jgi:hypothetical protein